MLKGPCVVARQPGQVLADHGQCVYSGTRRVNVGLGMAGELTEPGKRPSLRSMGSVRQHRVFVAWLVTLTLLSNVLASALCLVPASGKAAALTDVLGTLVICTSNGAATATDHGGGDTRPSAEHCQACLLLAGFVLLAAVALVLLTFPPPLVFKPMRALVRTLADHLSLGGIHSRAPPLSA